MGWTPDMPMGSAKSTGSKVRGRVRKDRIGSGSDERFRGVCQLGTQMEMTRPRASAVTCLRKAPCC